MVRSGHRFLVCECHNNSGTHGWRGSHRPGISRCFVTGPMRHLCVTCEIRRAPLRVARGPISRRWLAGIVRRIADQAIRRDFFPMNPWVVLERSQGQPGEESRECWARAVPPRRERPVRERTADKERFRGHSGR
ncbi:hypothetical protein CU044_0259 [Streptomyces sp. L-9-10]|nr:hypothetical protein CU044_0259 [Streptomyces sp. L-9-10]